MTYHVDGHERHKENILAHIEDADSGSHNDTVRDMTSIQDGHATSTTEERISNTDYFSQTSTHTDYMKYILNETPVSDMLLAEFNKLGYDSTEIGAYWFQQYHDSDTHSWHTHGDSHWAVVYYVELPESAPPTHIRSPYHKETIVPDVGEGDVLVIPAQVIHRSPPNPTDDRKTVVAFNVVCSGDCH